MRLQKKVNEYIYCLCTENCLKLRQKFGPSSKIQTFNRARRRWKIAPNFRFSLGTLYTTQIKGRKIYEFRKEIGDLSARLFWHMPKHVQLMDQLFRLEHSKMLYRELYKIINDKKY